MTSPKMLYHYTSLSTLALILKTKEIRFSRLDKLDDPQECKTSDSNNLAKTRFVSCWTDCDTESIPMWREYTGNGHGVRIGMPADPFERYAWNEEEVKKVAEFLKDDAIHPCEDALLPFGEVWDKQCFALQTFYRGSILKRVAYTDDEEKLSPSVLEDGDGSMVAKPDLLGMHKATAWEYQSEWRYLITVAPWNLRDLGNDSGDIAKRFRESLSSSDGPDIYPSEYYLKLSDNALRSIRITKSPMMTPGDEELLDALVERYYPHVEPERSSIEMA